MRKLLVNGEAGSLFRSELNEVGFDVIETDVIELDEIELDLLASKSMLDHLFDPYE